MSNEDYLFYYEYDGDEFGVIDQDDKAGKLKVRNLGSEAVKVIESGWLADKMETMEVEMSLER